jgi:hypothetical protein
LWRDFYGEPKQSLAAWSMVCRPKKCGGLGIVDFQKQNAALLIKFLDKFYNKVDLPWVHLLWSEYYLDTVPHWEKLKGSFWWRDVLKQVDNYRGVTSIKIGRGDTAFFGLTVGFWMAAILLFVIVFPGCSLLFLMRVYLLPKFIARKISRVCFF